MKILLDIDDTAIITNDRGKSWFKHPKLESLISEHKVVLYSGNPDIGKYAQEWKTAGYIAKGTELIPEADVLIDNDPELWKETVDTKMVFNSIDSFYKYYEKNKK